LILALHLKLQPAYKETEIIKTTRAAAAMKAWTDGIGTYHTIKDLGLMTYGVLHIRTSAAKSGKGDHTRHESSTLGKEQIVENPTFSADHKVCMFLLIMPEYSVCKPS
jgi:hypothetical protein